MVGDMKSVSLPPVTVKVSVRKLELSLNLDENVEDDVAVESPIEIILNGKSIATLLATPSLIEELAIGFLLDEGIVDSKDDLVSVRAIGKTVDVETKERGVRYEKSRNTGLVLTSCGSSGYSKSSLSEQGGFCKNFFGLAYEGKRYRNGFTPKIFSAVSNHVINAEHSRNYRGVGDLISYSLHH